MATKATGVYKEVRIKKETGNWGDLETVTGAKKLRRVSGDFNPTADNYTSAEITPTFQNTDTRLGVHGVEGSLNGELSPGSYSDFFGSILARDFTAVAGVSGASITIAASGTNFTITRGAGDFVADGIKQGHVVQLTGVGLDAANVGNNLLVISMTTTELTVKVLSETPLVAEGPIASVDVAPTGMTTYVPTTGHTDDSYNIEQWFSNISQSEVYTGVKVGSANVQIPASGFVTTDFSFMGKGLQDTDTTEYFTTPTEVGTDGLLTAKQGALVLGGSQVACLTDASIAIERVMEPAQCVGHKYNSDILTGKITVTGSLTAYFTDTDVRDKFTNETEFTLIFSVTTSNAKDAGVVTYTLPRVKLTSYNGADSETGITISADFSALRNTVTAAGLIDSTIMIQDSSLV